ncbi:hypothetical protein MRS44_003832 [Fusarium solani]|uniref:uncharacterized protein n=1 Tax=Fusarium solani TaxID=169388 RepID=UPI0032C414B8|nr:hypothetical protein MRS44_003832 [Fusarium solani]
MSSFSLLLGSHEDYCSGYDLDLQTPLIPGYADREPFDLIGHADGRADPMVVQELAFGCGRDCSSPSYLYMEEDTGLSDRYSHELLLALDDCETGPQQCWLDFFHFLEGHDQVSTAGGYTAEGHESAQQLSTQQLGPGRTGEKVAETSCEISRVPAQHRTNVAIPTSDDDDNTPYHGNLGSAFVRNDSYPQQKPVFIDLTLSDTEESDGEDNLPTIDQLMERVKSRVARSFRNGERIV